VTTQDLIDILLNVFYSFAWYFAGMYVKSHPEAIAGFFLLGRNPPRWLTKCFRILGLWLAATGLAAIALALAFFVWFVFLRK
jgi:hypothetical protein